MKLIAIITLLACTVSLTDASTCTECTDAYTTTTDCGFIKTYISCLVEAYVASSTAAGCSEIKTKMTAAKDAYETNNCDTDATNKVTDVCLCEVAYYTEDLTCNTFNARLACLFKATGDGCNAEKRHDLVTTAENNPPNSCILSKTCKCEIGYYKRSDNDDKCSGVKEELECLFDATDAGCGGVSNIETVGVVKSFGKTVQNCEFGVCECQAIYYETDTTKEDKKCAALKNAITCVGAATGKSCDDAHKPHDIATTYNSLITGDCKSGLTDTCTCQITYAKEEVTVTTTKCQTLTKEMHCLVKSDGVGCDGTTTRSAVAIATDGLIDSVANCRTGLTDTCKCAIAYAMTDTTKKAEKCKTATTAQTCLKKISSVTDLACDKVTNTEKYLNETFIPIITEACGGTSLLLSTSVAMGCLLIVFEMFH